ncbi:hypothetical protein [Streptacidiphilus sp. P02-A3a]|uniref:hypothetical protein n=1 Tax=Streptacidiphilus sp. P02-A3a TaxID=2704468 RepID=UPI0015F92E98|nr:hypothetical protein [Streptacidiphilus sp. P02-A3a]QMU68064.1 hypothetical protein GXP74_07355 [Streptacidiphilus sp. P02-A3a]
MVGIVLCGGLTAVLDSAFLSRTSGDGPVLLVFAVAGAAVGVGVTRWRGPVSRRLLCVAAGVFLAQAVVVLSVVIVSAILHVLFGHLSIPW